MADKGQKTQEPTQHRLHKAREEGQFSTSREFVGGLQFLAFVAMVTAWGGRWMDETREAVRILLTQAFEPSLSTLDIERLASMILSRIFVPLGLAGAILVAVTLLVQLGVTRGGISLKRLMPKFDRMNPAKRLPDIPKQSIPSAIQATVTLVVFGAVTYFIARENVQTLFLLPLAHIETGVGKVWAAVSELLWKAAAVFVVIGAIDFFRQRRRFMKDMKMSQQEIRDEQKESEGNPQIKMRIRRIQRDLLRRQMMREVQNATAVIVNPTHYAVALKYDRDTMPTPVVVAKGKNFLALRIRQRAIDNHVPLIENPPLAQALYKSVEVGQEIPANFYRAVAEILAYVYRLMQVAAR